MFVLGDQSRLGGEPCVLPARLRRLARIGYVWSRPCSAGGRKIDRWIADARKWEAYYGGAQEVISQYQWPLGHREQELQDREGLYLCVAALRYRLHESEQIHPRGNCRDHQSRVGPLLANMMASSFSMLAPPVPRAADASVKAGMEGVLMQLKRLPGGAADNVSKIVAMDRGPVTASGCRSRVGGGFDEASQGLDNKRPIRW